MNKQLYLINNEMIANKLFLHLILFPTKGYFREKINSVVM